MDLPLLVTSDSACTGILWCLSSYNKAGLQLNFIDPRGDNNFNTGFWLSHQNGPPLYRIFLSEQRLESSHSVEYRRHPIIQPTPCTGTRTLSSPMPSSSSAFNFRFQLHLVYCRCTCQLSSFLYFPLLYFSCQYLVLKFYHRFPNGLLSFIDEILAS